MDRTELPVPATYRRSPIGALFSLVIALAYGASPIDLLPDLIPILGLLDDVVLVPAFLLLAWSFWRKRKARLASA